MHTAWTAGNCRMAVSHAAWVAKLPFATYVWPSRAKSPHTQSRRRRLVLLQCCLIDHLLIAVMPQPAIQKAIAAFLLEYLVNEPVICSLVACDAVENEAAELQRIRPLPYLAQFVIA